MYLLFSQGIDTYPYSLGNDSLILYYVYLIIRHHAWKKRKERESERESKRKSEAGK